MTRRTSLPLLALAAAAALGLSACGSSSDDSATGATAPATTSAASAPAETAATTTPASAPSRPGGTRLTPVGSELSIGDAAVVAYEDPSNKGAKGTVEITPVSIERGTIGDFKNIQLDEDQQDATPFYVKLKAKNAGRTNLTGSNPANYISGVDDRGQRQNSLILIGDFPRCDVADTPKSLKPGESYESCQTFLIPRGGSLEGMVWVAFDPAHPDAQDITWR